MGLNNFLKPLASVMSIHTYRANKMHIAQPALPKLNRLGYRVLPHLPYSPDLSSTDYHFSKLLDNFFAGKCFHNQQDTGNAF